MKNYVQSGDVVTVTAPVAVASGGFLSIGELSGFAQADAAQGADVALATRGVFDAAIDNAAIPSTGSPIFTPDGDTLTAAADDGAGNAYMKVGVAVSDPIVEDGAARVKVKIG